MSFFDYRSGSVDRATRFTGDQTVVRPVVTVIELRTAIEEVGPRPAGQVISTGCAAERVDTTTASYDICSRPAVRQSSASSSAQPISATLSKQPVSSLAAKHDISVTPATDDVIATKCVDRVGTRRARDDVVAFGGRLADGKINRDRPAVTRRVCGLCLSTYGSPDRRKQREHSGQTKSSQYHADLRVMSDRI